MKIARSGVRTLVALVNLLVFTQRGVAQVTVQGQQGLTFGTTLPGVDRTIAPTDAIHAGRFYVRHAKGGQVRLTLSLPNNLVKSGGTTLRTNFSSTSAVIQPVGSSTSTAFNPNNNKNYTFASTADIYVRIGGTIQPKNNQASGTYSGTITLTVAVLQ